MEPQDRPYGASNRSGPSPHSGADSELVALSGSQPERRPSDEPAGRPDPAAPMTVTVYLRLPQGGNEPPGSAGRGGAAPWVVETVKEHARGCGLTVEPSVAPEAVRMSGPVSAVERCFGVRLAKWRTAEGTDAVAPEGPAQVPRAVAGEVLAVLGLDTRPVAHRHD